MGKFEVFEHTADVGLRIEAADLAELFTEAARGAFALVVENPDAIRQHQSLVIELEAEDVEGLFVDWLRELIYRFETDHLLLSEFNVRLSDGNRRLRAECRGEVAQREWTMPARQQSDGQLVGGHVRASPVAVLPLGGLVHGGRRVRRGSPRRCRWSGGRFRW